MTCESLEFIQTLFQRASVGAIALTAMPISPGKNPTCHVPLGLNTLLTQALNRLSVINQAGIFGGFVGMATRRLGLAPFQRGGKADLLDLPALFADVDRPPHELYPMLTHVKPTPSLIIASGFGTHLYWLLAEPTADWQDSDRTLTGLAHALGGDRLTVAQSMRLPGTRNLKPGRGPCFILQSEPQRLYTLNDFTAYLPPRRKQRPICPSSGVYLDDLAEAISDVLIDDYGGYLKANGWLAARCPAGHAVDYPGKHFFFNEALHIGQCFGKHGLFLLKDLKLVLGRNLRYEGVVQ
jgi:hypothetical protein